MRWQSSNSPSNVLHKRIYLEKVFDNPTLVNLRLGDIHESLIRATIAAIHVVNVEKTLGYINTDFCPYFILQINYMMSAVRTSTPCLHALLRSEINGQTLCEAISGPFNMRTIP